MKKELIIIGIIAILFCVELSGCNSSTEEKSIPVEKILGEEILKTYI